MADPVVLAIVWGEASAVSPKDGADVALSRLEAVLSKLATQARKQGLEGRMHTLPPPRVGSQEAARYQRIISTADAIENGTWSGVALPARAALWEVTVGGRPRLDPALPPAVQWITEQDVASGGEFVLGDGADGRVYRLFESPKVPAEGELPFASALTRTGLPALDATRRYTNLAWFLGIAAVLVFLLGAALSAWTGRSLGNARNLLVAINPGDQYALLAAATDLCAADLKAFPGGPRSAICDSLMPAGKLPGRDVENRYELPNAASVLAAARACPKEPGKAGCETIWRAALEVEQAQRGQSNAVATFWRKLSAYLGGIAIPAGSASILLPFLMTVCGLAGLTIALGLATKQRVAGVWIDSRNRVSLARAQVTLWTAVALAGYATLALFNIGFAGIAGPAAVAAGAAAAGSAAFAVFPRIPEALAAALGIAAVSPMLSALILPSKNESEAAQESLAIRGGDSDLRRRGIPFFGAESDGLAMRASPQLASIADIFMGEENANADIVDVARLQNVVITITLVLGFFSALVAATAIGSETLLGAKAAIFDTLPELGASFAALLLASHAAYLVSKAHDAQSPGPQEQPRKKP